MVLVVEDDSYCRNVLCDVLCDEGFEAIGKSDGLQALEHLRRHPETSIIVLDLMMPRMDGYQFRRAQLAEEALANIPVIVLTAQEMDRVAEFDALHVLAKPIQLAPLLQAVNNVYRGSEQVPSYPEFH